jgi:hypothetical protein
MKHFIELFDNEKFWLYSNHWFLTLVQNIFFVFKLKPESKTTKFQYHSYKNVDYYMNSGIGSCTSETPYWTPLKVEAPSLACKYKTIKVSTNNENSLSKYRKELFTAVNVFFNCMFLMTSLLLKSQISYLFLTLMARISHWRGCPSTVDLLVLNSLYQMLLIK